MHDPNLAIQSALFSALTLANLNLNGVVVPTYAYAPTSAKAPYVLIDQISTVPLAGARGCNNWEAVYQLTVLTSFNNVGDDTPSLVIQEQIVTALSGPLPALAGGFQLSNLTIAQTRKSSRYDQNSLSVLRYIQLKMRVHQEK